jgi:hypothetical protein
MRRSTSAIYWGRALPDSHALTFQNYSPGRRLEALEAAAGAVGPRLNQEAMQGGEPPIYPESNENI